MSHAKQRTEKNCLNCGATVAGRYCQQCGQENTVPKETVWGLVSHFFYDITHFDGKFFSTVKFLITRPGFLSREYISGRRARYLHPVRMYVFTSAFFFVIFFSLFSPESFLKSENSRTKLKNLAEAKTDLTGALATSGDSLSRAAIARAIVKVDAEEILIQEEADRQRKADSTRRAGSRERGKAGDAERSPAAAISSARKQVDSVRVKRWSALGNDNDLNIGGLDFKTKLAYDAVQDELPVEKKDNWFVRGVKYRAISVGARFENDDREALSFFAEKFMHTLPQALFVSLPAFALILLLLYARRKYYYTDHAIFSIYLYCAVFLLLLAYFGFDKLGKLTDWTLFGFLKIAAIMGIFVYLYKAMRAFYQQGRLKTIAKLLILYFMSIVLVSLVVSLFFFWVLWKE